MQNAIIEKLTEEVKRIAGEGIDVWQQQINKNNNVLLHAIVIKERGNAITPVVYIDWFVKRVAEKNITVEEAAQMVFEVYEKRKLSQTELEEIKKAILDRDFILSHVEYQVINRERNREKLKEVPHREMLDLAVCYRLIMGCSADEEASSMISNEQMEATGISQTELDEAAYRNTEKTGFHVKTLVEALEEIEGLPPVEETCIPDVKMLMLSCKRERNGANVLLYDSVLQEAADRLGGECLLIPSSIHEVLAVPVDMDPEMLEGKTKEINGSELPEEEVLGSRIYRYSRKSGLAFA